MALPYSPSLTPLFWLFISLGALAQVRAGEEDCLTHFPALFSLQTGWSGETREQRVSQTHHLLATKLKKTPEQVTASLKKLVEESQKAAGSPKRERAASHFVLGLYADAEKLAIEAGDEAHRATPRQPDQIIAALQLAAFAAQEQGHYEDSVKFLGVALGETSPERDLPAWTLLQAATAQAYGRMKMLKNEEQTTRHIYTEHERLLGAQHPETIKYQSELAGLLYRHGHDQDAERETRAVLAATMKLHGNKSEATQIVRKNLARVLEAQGKLAEAETLRREVVAAQFETLGGGAATTLRSREQLIKNLFEQKKFAEAETEAATLRQHSERMNGPDSATTLNGRIQQALAISQQQRHEEALKLLKSVQADATRTLGAEHPDTLRILSAQGACLNSLKDYAGAEKILLTTAETQSRVLPKDDLMALETRHQLAISLLRQNKLQEALKEIRAVSTSYQSLFKTEDPRNQAINQTAIEFAQIKEARRILIDEQLAILEAQIRNRGEDHVEVLQLRLNAAQYINSLGHSEEALAHYQKTYNGCLKTLKKDHPSLPTILQKIGVLQTTLGNFPEAAKNLTLALEKMLKQPEPNELAIAETRFHLGSALGQIGRLKESQHQLEQCYLVIKDRKDVNPTFVEQAKNFLQQLAQLLAPKPLSTGEPGTLQKPVSLSTNPTPSASAVLSQPGATRTVPNVDPGTLVPSGTIQKPLEYKP